MCIYIQRERERGGERKREREKSEGGVWFGLV